MRKIILMLLGGVICLLGITPVLANGVPYIETYATPQAYYEATGNKIEKFSGAPELRTLVAAGELPPVEQRLPKEPFVVEPLEEIGVYGGTLKTAGVGIREVRHMPNAGQYGTILWRQGSSGAPVIPYLAKSWEVSKDNTVFTFHLREGMKWSDGYPFTVDDITFWYEDVLGNEELSPGGVLPQLISAGEPAKFEKIDDYTLRVTFAASNTFFIEWLASSSELYPWRAKHYFEQFHPKYTDEESLEARVKEEGYEFWFELFGEKDSWQMNPERPTIRPWIHTVEAGEVCVLDRNPYYWKVDTQGNQLPYIDHFFVDIVGDNEIVRMRAMAGELDRADRGVTMKDYALLMKNAEKGDYRIIFVKRLAGGEPCLYLNQTVKGYPGLRDLFQERKFRIALSVGIDRDEINEAYFSGMGVPRQGSLLPANKFYDSEWEKAYAEYDPALANKLLDEIGLDKRNKDGFRLYADGTAIPTLVIETCPIFADWVGVSELVTMQWEKIGIKATVKSESVTLHGERCGSLSSEVMISAWPMDWISTAGVLACPQELLGGGFGYGGRQVWAPLWGKWYESEGEVGEEPSSEVKKIQELWSKALATPSVEERDAYIREIINIHKENIFIIGTVGDWGMPVVVKNRLRNVPNGMVTEFYSVEQWFLRP